jgi:response regulator RpfG family c-di-GMP phosphodiesterase
MAAPTQLTFSDESISPGHLEVGPKRIRTVVVDDSPTFLEVTCELLELDPLIDVVARAGKGGEAIETVLKLQPELVLMDVNMPYLDGLTLAWFFTRRFPWRRLCLCPLTIHPNCTRHAKRPARSTLFTKKTSGRNLVPSYNVFVII